MVSEYERARGAAWRIWDLHVHTPASIVQGYGGDTESAWSRFIDELEGLPEDIKVIGINDYWFLDGYERVREAWLAGRLQNLDAIFPVVEMRLDQFGGTAGALSRVNLHVIFDPELTPELIRAQFLSALQSRLVLSPEHQELTWQGVITRDSLKDLGQKIKATVPPERLAEYGDDLQEGFNNINVPLAAVQSVLQGSFFRGKAIIGIGKTEWADIKWSEQSIAAKKNVINSASLVFSAFQDTSRWHKDVQALREANVNHRLLDCSDAHHFSDSSEHIRLGACQTWMNTTPTLAGLAYALQEFDRRVFVGLEPPSLARIRKSPEQFISRIEVKSDRADHDLFDYELPLNSGFVAVVGNKGQGKSALLDCIALGGNSSRNREFAFLTQSRFLSSSNVKIARQYHAEIEWTTGSTRKVELTGDHDKSTPVYVEYLPQAFVERVCNSDPVTGDAEEFERELRVVLFTHIQEEERAGERSFDALLAQKTRSSQEVLDRLRDELRSAIGAYVTESSFQAENKLSEVQGRLRLKENEVKAAAEALVDAQEALKLLDATGDENDAFAALRAESEELDTARRKTTAKQSSNQQAQAKSKQALSEMTLLIQRAESLREDVALINEQALKYLAESAGPLVTLVLDRESYDSWRSTTESSLAELKAEQEVLGRELTSIDADIKRNAEGLAASDSARERARQRVIQSEERLEGLAGSEDDEESMNGLRALQSRVESSPERLSALRDRLLSAAGAIHAALQAQLQAVESLYQPASDFIQSSDVVKNAGLEFNAELRILPSWQSVASGLDGRKNGDFVDWLGELPQRVEDTSWAQLSTQLREAIIRLEHERGDKDELFRNPAQALRRTTTLPEFLTDMLDLSWLEVRFGLTGDGLPLSQLSPGQRGLVLALFYLVVDRRSTPLLLDQPEENLDNETIASKLVPAIHEAAGRRQTIVVTHNANLAVVGDADQIIHCQMSNKKFTVTSGSIAELDVAQFALNILEGTKPAFDNRRNKYAAFPALV